MSPEAVHGILLRAAELWGLALVGGFLVAAVRARSGLERVLALDVLGLVLGGVLGLVAFERSEIAYLDGTLALVLLSFVGTAAAARLARLRGRF